MESMQNMIILVKKKKLLKFLNKNNIKLLKNNEIENIYMTKL